jgi:hypothetical protein
MTELIFSAAIVLLASPLCSVAASAQAGGSPPAAAPPPTSEPSTQSQMSLNSWHAQMSATALPRKGCFVSSFPSNTWQEVPCGSAPPYPQGGMKRGPHPFNIGSGTDDFALAQGGNISSATGSFDSVTGVTNEYGLRGGLGSIAYPNTYTLQLNTNEPVNLLPCQGHPQCLGWE